jgi:hypothetical protein
LNKVIGRARLRGTGLIECASSWISDSIRAGSARGVVTHPEYVWIVGGRYHRSELESNRNIQNAGPPAMDFRMTITESDPGATFMIVRG